MTGQSLRVVGINAAGITSKLHSFDKLIFDRKPAIWMIQETKRKTTDPQIKTNNLINYQIFELKREKTKEEGGKPRCRYVHTEDGEIIPPRMNREEPRVQREEVWVTREEGRLPMGDVRVTREEGTLPRKEVRVTRTEASRQGFVNPASLQPPPENTMKNYPVLKRPQSSDWLKLWAKH